MECQPEHRTRDPEQAARHFLRFPRTDRQGFFRGPTTGGNAPNHNRPKEGPVTNTHRR